MSTINYVSGTNPTEIAQSLKAIKDKLKEVAELKKKLDTAEKQHQEALVLHMAQAGISNMKFVGIGTMSISKKESIRFSDYEKFKAFAVARMSAGELDVLSLLQQTPQQTNIKALLDSGVTPEELGVEIYTKEILSFKK